MVVRAMALEPGLIVDIDSFGFTGIFAGNVTNQYLVPSRR
jgi:hypothetical protein